MKYGTIEMRYDLGDRYAFSNFPLRLFATIIVCIRLSFIVMDIRCVINY